MMYVCAQSIHCRMPLCFLQNERVEVSTCLCSYFVHLPRGDHDSRQRPDVGRAARPPVHERVLHSYHQETLQPKIPGSPGDVRLFWSDSCFPLKLELHHVLLVVQVHLFYCSFKVMRPRFAREFDRFFSGSSSQKKGTTLRRFFFLTCANVFCFV